MFPICVERRRDICRGARCYADVFRHVFAVTGFCGRVFITPIYRSRHLESLKMMEEESTKQREEMIKSGQLRSVGVFGESHVTGMPNYDEIRTGWRYTIGDVGS